MSRRMQLAITLACALASIGGQIQQRPQAVTLSTPSRVEAVMIARNGNMAAGVCHDHKLRVWSLPDAHLVQTLDLSGREMAATAVSDDGHWLLFGDYRGGVTVWDSSTGQARLEQRFDRYLIAAAFSHDSRLLAIAPGGRPVRIIDLVSNRVLNDLESTPTTTNAVAFSRDGAVIGTADGDALRVYEVSTGKLISQNTDFSSEPLAVEFTRDGKQAVAAGGDKVVMFIQTPTGKTVRRTQKTAEVPVYLGVSPDGSQLAAITLSADDMSLPAPVIVWDIVSLQQRLEWLPPTGVLGGIWTQDGHFVAATSTPQALHLWRLR